MYEWFMSARSKKNGISALVKLGIGVAAFGVIVWFTFNFVGALISLGRISEALSIAILVLQGMLYIVKDVFTSAREEISVSVPAGYKISGDLKVEQE